MRRASIYGLAGLLIALSFVALTPSRSLAQHRLIEPEVRRATGERLRQRVATVDTVITPRTRRMHDGRVDVESGVVRARYRIDADDRGAAQRADDPFSFLRSLGDELGIADPTTQLVVDEDLNLPHSRHLTFRQVLGGTPVFGAYVRINIGADGEPTMVLNGFHPHITASELPAATIDTEDAAQIAANQAGQAILLLGEPEEVIYASDPPRRAWHLVARASEGPAEWSLLIDAATGDVLSWIDQRTHAHESTEQIDAVIDAVDDWPRTSNHSAMELASDAQWVASVDGRGFVFDPDPLTSAGVEYGPPYVDADDADISELNAERVEVPLRDISYWSDGLYRLSGPYVDIVGASSSDFQYIPPALADAQGFDFTRGHEHFEAVNSYFHIDQSQRYVQTAVPETPIHNSPVRVNPRAWTQDNSTYTPGANPRTDGFIRFGTGGIDDAEDAHVILHEYAHALLEVSARNLRAGSLEGQALHEGWADYWAVSYTRELIEMGAVPPRDWRKVFTWDGNESWEGRYLEHTGMYPEDAPCTRGACNIYNDGTLWATTLMEVYDVLGRQMTDRLNLLSHLYLIPPATMQDAAEAIIQADLDYHDGVHLSTLLDVFGLRGFVQMAEFAPIVRHEPPPSTERTTGTLRFTAYITGETPPDIAYFVHLDDEATEERTAFVHQSDSTYVVDIPLSAGRSVVRYFIEVVGPGGTATRLPLNAPHAFFAVETGPDLDPPVISHDPPTTVSHPAWPATISAHITDRMGIDSAWVSFASSGSEGAFGLAQAADDFTGTFPNIDLAPGDVVTYRIHARDNALAGNTASSGTFAFEVVRDITIRHFRLECVDDGVTASGVWDCGIPVLGTHIAWEGEAAWHAPLGGAAGDVSSLLIPPVRIGNAESPHLVFWHWHDFDGGGASIPPNQNTVSAGGNVKYSVDGGDTWIIAEPEDSYSAAFGADHPLAGEPAFGGYSFGWRREVVPLPMADSVWVRFDAAQSENTAGQAAGWYVDDITFVAERPADDEPPEIITTPQQAISISTGARAPEIIVEVRDNVGVESVRLPYVLQDRDGVFVEEGEARLAMSDTSAAYFGGVINTDVEPEAGWQLSYEIVAADFDGNIARGDGNGVPFLVEYVHTERRDLMSDLQPTGAWWRAADRYRVDGAEATGRTSSLLTAPLDLPSGVSAMRLELDHVHNVGEGLGGNVKLSTDGGRSWQILEPVGAYPRTFAGDHRMADEGIFGSASGIRRHSFDLLPYAGSQVQLRLGFGAVRALHPSEQWVIHDLGLEIIAPTHDIETPREWQLHANYPNPFSSTTTISWTIAEYANASVELYDVLGRRVDTIERASLAPDTYTLVYDGSGLGSGVYFLRMSADGVVLTRKIVIAR